MLECQGTALQSDRPCIGRPWRDAAPDVQRLVNAAGLLLAEAEPQDHLAPTRPALSQADQTASGLAQTASRHGFVNVLQRGAELPVGEGPTYAPGSEQDDQTRSEGRPPSTHDELREMQERSRHGLDASHRSTRPGRRGHIAEPHSRPREGQFRRNPAEAHESVGAPGTRQTLRRLSVLGVFRRPRTDSKVTPALPARAPSPGRPIESVRIGRDDFAAGAARQRIPDRDRDRILDEPDGPVGQADVDASRMAAPRRVKPDPFAHAAPRRAVRGLAVGPQDEVHLGPGVIAGRPVETAPVPGWRRVQSWRR